MVNPDEDAEILFWELLYLFRLVPSIVCILSWWLYLNGTILVLYSRYMLYLKLVTAKTRSFWMVRSDEDAEIYYGMIAEPLYLQIDKLRIIGVHFSIDLCRVETTIDSTPPLSSKNENSLFIVLHRFWKRFRLKRYFSISFSEEMAGFLTLFLYVGHFLT